MAHQRMHFLAHPLTRDLDIDDPRVTDLRRQVIRAKPFVRRIYQEWYTEIAAEVPAGEGRVLELGSGAGFMDEYVPDLITSDIMICSWVKLILDGRHLPFAQSSLKAIVMTNTLHHIPQPRTFLAEAARCLRPGGRLIMHEPWVTRWSKRVYRRLHHEPIRPDAETWEFPEAGPLSGANQALPWIIFRRDRELFAREFPQFRIARIEPSMPFRYLVSGGLSMRSLMPFWSYGAWQAADRAAQRLSGGAMAMFALIVLERG